jgi:hypothetical protein
VDGSEENNEGGYLAEQMIGMQEVVIELLISFLKSEARHTHALTTERIL